MREYSSHQIFCVRKDRKQASKWSLEYKIYKMAKLQKKVKEDFGQNIDYTLIVLVW